MNVVHGLGRLQRSFPRTVLAIGVFDGVHLGHRYLIREVVKRARAINGTAMVMTFYPHPVQVLRPEVRLPLLLSLRRRLDLIENLGVDVCLVVRFSKKFSRLTAQNFVKKYLVRAIKPRLIFIGHDFCFGRGRKGDVSFLRREGKRYGFEVRPLKGIKKNAEVVSSTLIRRCIAVGDLQKAHDLLGRWVAIEGKVVHGESRGKKLGYPTANIHPAEDLIVPGGVYAVRVSVGKRNYFGMANIGTRPSFRAVKNNVVVEVHLFDFQKNIYGKNILIEFIHKVREERRFSSPLKLSMQLKEDERKIRQFFTRHFPQ